MADEILEIKENNKVKKGRKFDQSDFDTIAVFIRDTWMKRKKDRNEIEKNWDEIDRQLKLKPEDVSSRGPGGHYKEEGKWLPAMELPNQAYTLEVLTADARRMLFPDSGNWFTSHVLLSDSYLKRIDLDSLVAGDENEVPTRITQDGADKLLTGWLEHYHNQYDFKGHIDIMNAEAFKYGTMAARARVVEKELLIDTDRGTIKKTQKIPVLFPVSIKTLYLDDTVTNLMHEGFMVSPAIIREFWRSAPDTIIAANKGSTSPDDTDGGWMPAQLKELEPDDNGGYQILEWEGDIVVPRKTVKSVYAGNTIITVAVGKNQARVFRFRFNNREFSSYLYQPYHIEGTDTSYGVSPLMKGMPIQKAASLILNRLIAWGVLNVQPPIAYDRGDPWFSAEGGPVIEPAALWPTLGKIEPKQIGNGEVLLQIYQALLKQYEDLTGVNAPRLGAQTISHTTAFAKNVEVTRGTVRTVDYVNSVMSGILNRWLQIELELGKEAMQKDEEFFISDYGGWVSIKPKHLPDKAVFDVYGNGEPQEEMAKTQKRIQSLQLAIQIDALRQKSGMPTGLNLDEIQVEILEEGGWITPRKFLSQQRQQQPALQGNVPSLGSGAQLGLTASSPASVGNAPAVTQTGIQQGT